jgi:hypothetical protein
MTTDFGFAGELSRHMFSANNATGPAWAVSSGEIYFSGQGTSRMKGTAVGMDRTGRSTICGGAD